MPALTHQGSNECIALSTATRDIPSDLTVIEHRSPQLARLTDICPTFEGATSVLSDGPSFREVVRGLKLTHHALAAAAQGITRISRNLKTTLCSLLCCSPKSLLPTRHCRRSQPTYPSYLAGQLALLINGAFLSSQIHHSAEATPLLQQTARSLVKTNRS